MYMSMYKCVLCLCCFVFCSQTVMGLKQMTMADIWFRDALR